MPSIPAALSSQRNETIAPFLSALVIVMFLFFIDEGYYDFRWMKDAGNWLVFVFYLAFFFLFQWLVWKFILRRLTGWQKVVAMTGLGLGLTFGFIWLVS